MMIQPIDPIRRETVVPASQQRAFETFTARITDWWPSRHHIGSADIEQVIIEPRAGGRWYTRHVDGTETSTGVVVAWEPPERLVVTWQISADWKFDPSLVTTVEVRFEDEGPDRTRVRLEHRDLDRYGPDAERMHETFDGPGAWEGTLAAFAGALEPVR
jgi:uncharacterized protein YndB with AHSA1/START domain